VAEKFAQNSQKESTAECVDYESKFMAILNRSRMIAPEGLWGTGNSSQH
jgi:hypothetical protein